MLVVIPPPLRMVVFILVGRKVLPVKGGKVVVKLKRLLKRGFCVRGGSVPENVCRE